MIWLLVAVSSYAQKSYGRATMRTKFLAMTAVVTSGVIATAFLVQSLSSSSAQTQAHQLPEYTASGDLVLPKNFHDNATRYDLVMRQVFMAGPDDE
jgi:hypothetical protein